MVDEERPSVRSAPDLPAWRHAACELEGARVLLWAGRMQGRGLGRGLGRGVSRGAWRATMNSTRRRRSGSFSRLDQLWESRQNKPFFLIFHPHPSFSSLHQKTLNGNFFQNAPIESNLKKYITSNRTQHVLGNTTKHHLFPYLLLFSSPAFPPIGFNSFCKP